MVNVPTTTTSTGCPGCRAGRKRGTLTRKKAVAGSQAWVSSARTDPGLGKPVFGGGGLDEEEQQRTGAALGGELGEGFRRCGNTGDGRGRGDCVGSGRWEPVTEDGGTG